MADDPDRPRGIDLIAPVIPVCIIVALMWAEEIVDTALGGDLDHNGFGHLLANTLPFLLLGSAIALGSLRRFAYVTAVTMLVCGVGTWLTGPAHTVHIGASGIVFGYLTYLLSRGWFARHLGYLLGGVLVFFIYGGALWGLLPSPGVSWQGHLFGALGGILAAWLLHSRREDADDL